MPYVDLVKNFLLPQQIDYYQHMLIIFD
jgi:hypothetical protein